MIEVSVIVTVHNSGDYLFDCLQSLKNQTLKNIEVIIVNDGSPDTRDQPIIDSFTSMNNRFFCISNEQNLGTGRSREIGVQKASGKYIGFLDSDDAATPNAFQRLFVSAIQHDCDIALSDYEKIPDKFDIESHNESQEPYGSEVISGERLFDIQVNRVNRPFYVRIDWWNKIYRRSLFTDNQVTFPHVVRNEGAMSMIMSLLAKRVVILNTPLYLTRVRSDSVCRTFRLKNIQDTITSTLHFKQWLIRLGIYKKYESLYINLFYYVVFNHNLQLMLKVDEEKQISGYLQLLESIEENKEVWRDFLRYINLPKRNIERIVYASLKNQAHKNILKQIKKTNFFYREEGYSTQFYRKNLLQKPKVSIVTIAINLCQAGRINYFEKMLDSVANQTYGVENIEHIVIDGNSTDGTVDYLRGLTEQERIDRWISEPDSGIYNAMNKGPLYSSGDFLLYLNSDDYLAKDCIKKLIESIQETGADYAFGDADKVNEKEHKVGKHVGNINMVYFGTPYCHQALICKKECFDKVRFDESFKITMWKFSLDLYLAGLSHTYVPDTVSYFRIGGVSTDKSYENKFKEEQSKIKGELIASRLGLTIDEYEYLNHVIRRWDIKNLEEIDVDKIISLLATKKDPFSKDFLSSFISLISIPETRQALPEKFSSVAIKHQLIE